MFHVIQEKLKEIEQKENVRILHCVESGSRAWGFASSDSDYDVRFIYVRNKEDYLKLEKTRDVIEWQLDDTLDINGWDIQKALRLLHKSNPTLFEWNASPIIYRTTEEWKRAADHLPEYFVTKAMLYHYLSMAKRNYKGYLKEETVQLKKYFYALRPLLACRWIVKEQTPPPMLFERLMDTCLDETMQPYAQKLLRIKMETPEITRGERIECLNHYIEHSMETIEQHMKALPAEKPKEWEPLNSIFLSLVNRDSN